MYCDPIYAKSVPAREPSAAARYREEYYLKAERAPKAPVHPSQVRGLAAFLRARTTISVGRFVPMI